MRQWGRLRALEGGVVVPPRYDRGDWQEGDGVFNAAALASYTRKLADRIEHHVRAGDFPLVLGGDCSINLGASLALRRLGRYGMAVLDASPDFRHPGNSGRIGAAGGEEIALGTGRGQEDLTKLLRPLLASPHCVGLNVTIYDPDLDPEGSAGALLADIVVDVFDTFDPFNDSGGPGTSGGFAQSDPLPPWPVRRPGAAM